jgi:penicillin-binding protein 2
VIDENTTFHCPGKIKIGNRLYHCHSRHGDVNVVRAITQSCDVFFYRVAQKLKSVDDIAKWGVILGLGKRTGINLNGEVPGLIPTEEWKRKRFNQPWNAGETATVAIGQSFVLATALQLANLYAAIGNGGTLFRPYIVRQIETAEGKLIKEFQPEVLSQVHLKPRTVELVKQGLWSVVNTPIGTAFSQRLPGMDFVGKTGTSQVIRIAAEKIYQKCESMKFRDRHNAMFVGFAPVKNPMIAVAVVGEHACHGASGAAPVARAIIKKYLEKYYPDLYGEKVLAARLKSMGQTPVITKAPKAIQVEDESFSDSENLLSPEERIPEAPPVPPPLPVSPAERAKARGANEDSDFSDDSEGEREE